MSINLDYTNIKIRDVLKQYKIQGSTDQQEMKMDSDYLRKYQGGGFILQNDELDRMTLMIGQLRQTSYWIYKQEQVLLGIKCLMWLGQLGQDKK
jgi:hypothetical protein